MRVPPVIPPRGQPITLEQADAILAEHADFAGELAAGVAVALRDAGRIVHGWTVLTADELVRAWPAELDIAPIAFVHYAPSQSIPFDAVQIRLDKVTGMVFVWDGRGVLG
jgi:hypothetical protein